MNSCDICTETYNRSTRLSIVCNSCEFSACRACYEQYALANEMSHSGICCMSCKIEWDELDISNKFSAKFITNYNKKHKVNILFENEKKLFPATQPLIEEIMRKREYDKKMQEYVEKIIDINIKINDLTEEYKRDVVKIQTKKFTIKRCVRDSCRGYLSNDWICGLCETKCCSECHFEMEDHHVCNVENIETAKIIKENGRPCPNCSTIIFKSEGCDQIYCTRCKTPFSWNTGKIENGAIHNPHYYEEMQNPERNLLEVRCGREIDNIFLIRLKKDMSVCFNTHYKKIIRTIGLNLMIIRLDHLPKFVNVITDNSDLRVRYLMEEITEEQFKITLKKRDKENRKHKKLSQILNMYVNSLTEIFYRLHYYTQLKVGDPDLYDYINFSPIDEIKGLIEYTNSCFEDIKKVYKCKSYIIDECGEFLRG